MALLVAAGVLLCHAYLTLFSSLLTLPFPCLSFCSVSFVVFGVMAGSTTAESRKSSVFAQQNYAGYSLKDQKKDGHH